MKEVDVARKIAAEAGVPFEVLDVSLIGQLTHNSLTDSSMVMDKMKSLKILIRIRLCLGATWFF